LNAGFIPWRNPFNPRTVQKTNSINKQ
jgi:hypothetical protein